MTLLLEDTNKMLNGNNVVNRVSYGLVGLDLKARKDESANQYLDSCISVFQDLDINKNSTQLMQIFDYEVPAAVDVMKKHFQELLPLLEEIRNDRNLSEIPKARDAVKKILNELYGLMRSRERIG